MTIENLSPRSRTVLEALIKHYIATADPVGSLTISNKYIKDLSPATIRNAMQDLEEMGLLGHPHTSAGRIPTNKGYRVYVDSLVKPEELSGREKENIRRQMKLDFAAVEEILGQTSKVLGQVSQELGVAVSPRFEEGVLTRIDLIPVAERKILVVLAIKSGLVRSLLLEIESSLDESLMEATRQVLNENLCGLTLGEIRQTINQRLKEVSSGDARLIRMFLESSDGILNSLQIDQLHLGGAQNVLKQPEFQDPKKLQDFLQLLEEKRVITELLGTQGLKEGISITIGTENEKGEMASFSLISCSYQAGKVKGSIGVIGPTRMPYPKLISLVDYTAKTLSEVLSE